MLASTENASMNIKEMYLTDTIPDTGIYTYTYAKSSLRPEGTTVVYSDNGDGSFNATVASTGTVYVDHPGVTLDVSKYNKFVLLATGDLGNEFWYKTTDSSWKAMLRSAKIKADDEYYYYVYDLSTKGLTGTFAQSTGFMMGFKEAGTIKIKNVFLTNSVPESDAHEYHYGLKNVRSEGYSSITQSNSAITLTAANTGNLYLDHVEPLDCSDYNKLVLKATVNPGYKVYYKTTADGGIAENRTVSTYTTVKAKDGYSYYVYDLSASSLYTGEIAKTMGFCLAATGSGTTTISDIYVTDTVPSTEYDAPYSYDEYSMRVSGVMGMRFMASVTLAEKAECDEYGFIVTRADMIDAETDLTFDLDTSKYVSGVAYDKDGDIDMINGEEDAFMPSNFWFVDEYDLTKRYPDNVDMLVANSIIASCLSIDPNERCTYPELINQIESYINAGTMTAGRESQFRVKLHQEKRKIELKEILEKNCLLVNRFSQCYIDALKKLNDNYTGFELVQLLYEGYLQKTKNHANFSSVVKNYTTSSLIYHQSYDGIVLSIRFEPPENNDRYGKITITYKIYVIGKWNTITVKYNPHGVLLCDHHGLSEQLCEKTLYGCLDALIMEYIQ